MVDSIRGSGNVPSIQQATKAQTQRSEQNKAERAQNREIQAQEVSERQAEDIARTLSREIADAPEVTLGKGSLLDKLL